MWQLIKKVLLVFILICSWQISFAEEEAITPIGKWQQIDEKTHQLHSVIQIYTENGRLFGKVLQTFPMNGKPPRLFCDLCQGALYNTPIIGLVIMENFAQLTGNTWGKGTILDPSSGKVYSCKLTLSADGNTLKVRGYIGTPLLGRTQIWQRQEEQ